jgi:ATP-dependent protease ClpP protease subunit
LRGYVKPSWYAVKNVTSESAEIAIYGEIGAFGVSAKSFIAQLKGLGDRRITLRIHSPGGEILEGTAIYNALTRHRGGVDVAIDGMCASMATVVAMAGETRTMAENGWFVIHNPFVGVMGESKDLRKQADIMDGMKDGLISAYESRTGMDRSELSDMMDEETWLTAKQAKKFGFITDITESLPIAASIAPEILARFDNVPQVMAANALSKFLNSIAKTFSIEGEEHTEDSILDALKEFPGLKAQLETVNGEVVALKDSVKAKDQEITSYADKVSEHLNTIKERDTAITNLTTERDTLKNDLTTRTSERDALKKAHGIAPAAVVPVIDPNPEAGGDNQAELAKEFARLQEADPEAATAFYAKHKDVLSRTINKAPASND